MHTIVEANVPLNGDVEFWVFKVFGEDRDSLSTVAEKTWRWISKHYNQRPYLSVIKLADMRYQRIYQVYEGL